jgi:hypothetical protein
MGAEKGRAFFREGVDKFATEHEADAVKVAVMKKFCEATGKVRANDAGVFGVHVLGRSRAVWWKEGENQGKRKVSVRADSFENGGIA